MCVGRVPSGEKEVHYPISVNLQNGPPVDVYTEEKENLEIMHQKIDFEYSQDILAVTTIWTKEIIFSINDYIKTLSDTKAYRILYYTTQPAHVVTSLAVLLVAFLCRSKSAVATLSPVWTLLYLGSFSAHFGAQIWMTFVSGLSLYFTMPRHTFGTVQKVLFPRYFLLNAFFSLITLAIFFRVKNNELRTTEIGIQAAAMSLCFLTELVIFLYFTPPLLSLISRKTAIEKEAGVGLEVGKFEPGKLKSCPHYMKIHKDFRKAHMKIAMGNIFTMACTTLHLYYLASKLCMLSL
ncbi:transmembrane protein 205 [Euwallacea fornicatus]|uniref:transmembrane protein 205 n=1 Tax=Euwallacea fornicatus TaxID=995702 RepID=UPI00339008FA